VHLYVHSRGTDVQEPSGDRDRVGQRPSPDDRGRIRRHKLTLVFQHLRRGRYKLTLIELGLRGNGSHRPRNARRTAPLRDCQRQRRTLDHLPRSSLTGQIGRQP
jgi:hypothetical protein